MQSAKTVKMRKLGAFDVGRPFLLQNMCRGSDTWLVKQLLKSKYNSWW